VIARSEPAACRDPRAIRAAIKEAMRHEDDTAPRGIWERPLKRADPGLAAALALDALENCAPDLQVAGWLVQAWVMTDGFAGAVRGLHLVHGLCDGDRDVLAERHGLDALERPFEWMSAHLVTALSRVEVTQSSCGAAAFTWEQRQAALFRDRVQRAAGERPAPGEATPDAVDEAAARTPTEFYARTERELSETMYAVEALQELLRERWPAGAPPSLAPIHRRAAEIRGWVAAQLAERPELEPDDTCPCEPHHEHHHEHHEHHPHEHHAHEHHAHEHGHGGHHHPNGPGIHTRAEAYAMLDAAAAYLERAEPHSPTPWLVRRAVAWGEMELGDLLSTLIDEGYDLRSLRSLLGLAGDGRP
jgi:type VI secretion system ImpA family protein